MASNREAWLSLLPSDPRPELLASNEPFARFVTMTEVLGASEDDPEVRDTRRAMGNGDDLRAPAHVLAPARKEPRCLRREVTG